jgi:hypothetical protein
VLVSSWFPLQTSNGSTPFLPSSRNFDVPSVFLLRCSLFDASARLTCFHYRLLLIEEEAQEEEEEQRRALVLLPAAACCCCLRTRLD